MNHKSLLLAVTLIAFLAIGGVFWVMEKRQVATNQPVAVEPVVETSVQGEAENPVDTSDWKTYRNEEYGFEMRYPESFAHLAPGEMFEGTRLADSSFRMNGGGHFEYDVWENPSDYTAAELLRQAYQEEYSGGWEDPLVTVHRSAGVYLRGVKDDGVCLIEINLFPDTQAFHVIRIELCNVERRNEKMKVMHDILSTAQY